MFGVNLLMIIGLVCNRFSSSQKINIGPGKDWLHCQYEGSGVISQQIVSDTVILRISSNYSYLLLSV